MYLKADDSAEDKRSVFHLYARGKSVKQISNITGLSANNVRRYIKEQKDDLTNAVRSINGEDYASLLLSRYDDLRREAWVNYENSSKAADKGRFLKLIAEINIKEQKQLEDLGILRTGHEEVVIDGDAVISEARGQDELQALTAMLIGEELGRDPKQLLSSNSTRRNLSIQPEKESSQAIPTRTLPSLEGKEEVELEPSDDKIDF